jgi:transcriptional regulator with XRE-family HTH domain
MNKKEQKTLARIIKIIRIERNVGQCSVFVKNKDEITDKEKRSSVAKMSRIERGITSPTLETLSEIAEALDMNIMDMMEEILKLRHIFEDGRK